MHGLVTGPVQKRNRFNQPFRTAGYEVKRFRGGLVSKAHRLVYHSTLGLRVIKQKKKNFRPDSEPELVRILTGKLANSY